MLAACSALACSTNHSTVVKLAATANYYKASHLEKCHQGIDKDPAMCKPCEAIIQNADTRSATALANDKMGYLPPQEVAEIKATVVALSGCP